MTNVEDTGTDRVAEALRAVGASHVGVTTNGDVDFNLGEISAWAYYETTAGYRISFILAFDPEKERAEAWADSHDDLAVGFVRYVESDEGSNLLYTIDVESDATDLNMVVDKVIDLHADWAGSDEGGITETLAATGLLRPPLGPGNEVGVRTYGPWWWGTRPIPADKLYMFELDEVVAELVEHGPFFAMSHAGHGLNSYGLNVVTVGGPFAVFFQHGFGGVYMSPLMVRLAINSAYSYLHVLLEAAQLEDTTNPKWLLAFSEFRGVCGIVELDTIRAGKSLEEAFTEVDGFGKLIGRAAALAPDDEFGAMGVRVDWPSAELDSDVADSEDAF